jgi:hypothetical protein
MFRLTSATRGGLLLMNIFFYSAYVLGAALWVETSEDPDYSDKKDLGNFISSYESYLISSILSF